MREVAYRVTLDLLVDRDEYDNPAEWDWVTLLEVPPQTMLAPPRAQFLEAVKATRLKLVKGTDDPDDRPSDEPIA